MKKTIVFQCSNPRCQADITDPLYHGPHGHYVTVQGLKDEKHTIPGNLLCYDCWVCAWELSRDYPSERDYLIALLYQRLTNREIAARLGVDLKTIYNRKKQLKRDIKKNYSIIRNWIADFAPSQSLP